MKPSRLALVFCMFTIMAPALAAQGEGSAGSAPTREQTLDSDLAGPSVEWTGAIIESWRDNDATCFLLRRMSNAAGYLTSSGDQFLACPFGFYDPAVYSTGHILQVSGNLGNAQPRTIGGRIVQFPLIAGAFVERMADPAPYPPYYGPYPGPYFFPRDRFFSPFPCDPHFGYPSPYSRCW